MIHRPPHEDVKIALELKKLNINIKTNQNQKKILVKLLKDNFKQRKNIKGKPTNPINIGKFSVTF